MPVTKPGSGLPAQVVPRDGAHPRVVEQHRTRDRSNRQSRFVSVGCMTGSGGERDDVVALWQAPSASLWTDRARGSDRGVDVGAAGRRYRLKEVYSRCTYTGRAKSTWRALGKREPLMFRAVRCCLRDRRSAAGC